MNSMQVICGLAGLICLLLLGEIAINGILYTGNIEEVRSFCHREGGYFMKPIKENYNTPICAFIDDTSWSDYAIEEVVNNKEEYHNRTGEKYCFVCYDSGSCNRDTLTRIDNGTRRDTRC